MTLGWSKRVGIATDHGGFGLKEELVARSVAQVARSQAGRQIP